MGIEEILSVAQNSLDFPKAQNKIKIKVNEIPIKQYQLRSASKNIEEQINMDINSQIEDEKLYMPSSTNNAIENKHFTSNSVNPLYCAEKLNIHLYWKFPTNASITNLTSSDTFVSTPIIHLRQNKRKKLSR